MRERRATAIDSQSVSNATYSPKQYWSNVAQSAGSADKSGFAPVLHPGAPAWFNELIDKLQYQAVRRALQMAGVASGALVLDVGCGTARWIRRYQRFGFRAFGVDATSPMLTLARRHGTTAPLIAGEAYRLPFPDAQFDCVSDITVVQHIPASLQPAALGEMIRVLRPNGRLILMELIRGRDLHVFPHRPQEWIEQAATMGAVLVGWFGQEFLIVDRAFVYAAQAMSRNGHKPNGAPKVNAASYSRHSIVVRHAYWAVRRVTAPLSVLIEPVVERLFAPEVATHGVFVFRKP